MAARGGENAAALQGGPDRGWIPPASAAKGEKLNLPHSRPMPRIGRRCHELLRITDEDATWRVIYRVDPDALIIAEVFSKKTSQTPKRVIDNAKNRLKEFDDA